MPYSKIPNANNLKNFRAIGLCNTAYKVIIKIIANRLKTFLPSLIIPLQSSFIKNKRTCDSGIIIQELMATIKNKKTPI